MEGLALGIERRGMTPWMASCRFRRPSTPTVPRFPVTRASPLRNDRFPPARSAANRGLHARWLMRQAGRYLPGIPRQPRPRRQLLAMAKNPDFACEVTLQPLERFPLDAAILFSDILTVPDAMGLGLVLRRGEG